LLVYLLAPFQTVYQQTFLSGLPAGTPAIIVAIMLQDTVSYPLSLFHYLWLGLV
jgi:hypothetical protein